MPKIRILQAAYFWDSQEKSLIKRNQDLGNLISCVFVFFYYLLFVFGVSGAVYPILQEADLYWLGYISGIINSLGYIANRWWFIIILFLIALILTFGLSMLFTKTSFSVLRTYIEYFKIDTSKYSKKEIINQVISDIAILFLYALPIFIVFEIVTMAISSIFFIFVLLIIFNITSNTLGQVYLLVLIVHIVVFPLFMLLYQYFLRKKMIKTSSIELKDFLKEDGEVDLEKWRARTWGRKPYSFDWEEEEFIPLTCFSCGSVISSNLTECPICNADLVKELEEIDTEYDIENEENATTEKASNEKSENKEINQ
jgi:hypothetical protein